jgi:OOP family OmpA-OmpF porin
MRSPALRFAVAALLLSGVPSTVAANTYWYAGLGMGLGLVQLYPADFSPSPNCPPTCTTDKKQESDAGFKMFIGYQINRTWAFEAGVTTVGKFHYKRDYPNGVTQDAIYKVKGLGLSFVPTIPFTRNFSLYGRLGAFSSQTRLTIHNQGGTAGNSSSGVQSNQFGPLTGVGAQYFFDEESGIRVEFENFGKVGSECSASSTTCTGRANAKMLSASLVFPF